ncbi:MAG: hypothetical protein WD874_01350 [Parcubacteria group bacterium]
MDSKKYIFAFIITILIFGTALISSDYLSEKKLADVRRVEERVALDILSSETQYSLLEETSCKDISPGGFLSSELGPLGEKLSYAESQNFKPADIEVLKRSYFLLEIKDYLLMKRLAEKCGDTQTFILYFYSNAGDCPGCENMGAVLTALRDKYPSLRVYSFDYSFDVPAIKTLIKIYKVRPELPALIINGETYYGFKTVDELVEDVPALGRLSTTTATSTTPTR